MYIVAFLAAIVAAFLSEVKGVGKIPPLVACGLYLIGALFIPEFVLFVPLVGYDFVRRTSWGFRLSWLVPLLGSMRFFEPLPLVFVVSVSAVSAFLALRTNMIDTQIEDYKLLRDELREESLALEAKNRDLRERQDMDIHLATLDERSRIAREIHDNVGHLLTRSVLQIEAYQVVHAKESVIREEFEQVGATVHEALNTVRASVHNLHEDSFDLEAQLKRTIAECPDLEVTLEYVAEEIPTPVAYCFIALTREALSNTLKHSRADKMSITVIEQPGFYRITLNEYVQSNKGPVIPTRRQNSMAPEQADDLQQGGIGLRTMEERVRSLQGIFRVDRNEGFKIIASIPRSNGSHHPAETEKEKTGEL